MSYWNLIETAFERVDIYNGASKFLEDFSQLSPPVQHLLAAHWCQSEVCNGGFDQFFENSTGVLAPEAEVGFRAIGLDQVADLVVEAMNRFGVPYPRDHDERLLAMEAIQCDNSDDEESDDFDDLGRRFADLDDRFYDLLPDSEFDRYANAFAEVHRGR